MPIHDKPAAGQHVDRRGDVGLPAAPDRADRLDGVVRELDRRNCPRAAGTGLSLVGNSVAARQHLRVRLCDARDGGGRQLRGRRRPRQRRRRQGCFYRLALGQWDGKGQWRLTKTEGGKETILASGDATVAAGVPHGLRLDCVGEYLIPYLDGRLLTGDVADWPDWPLTYGQAGVAAEGTQAKFTGDQPQELRPGAVTSVGQRW